MILDNIGTNGLKHSGLTSWPTLERPLVRGYEISFRLATHIAMEVLYHIINNGISDMREVTVNRKRTMCISIGMRDALIGAQ